MSNETTQQDQEELGMAQRLEEIEAHQGLGIEHAPSPLEERVPEKIEEPEPEPPKGFLGSDYSDKDAPKGFLGSDYSDKDVLGLLARIPSIEEAAAERAAETVLQKVMGKFGDVGRELKELRDSGVHELEFDLDQLKALEEVDPATHKALIEALPKAIKAKQLDPAAVVAPLIEAAAAKNQTALDMRLGNIHDATQEQLVQAIVPGYLDLSAEKDFVPWLRKQDKGTWAAFETWDDDGAVGQRDAASLIRTYQAYETHKRTLAEEKRTAEDAARRTAERPGGAVASSAQPLVDEEAAFAARLKEIEAATAA